MSNHKKKCPIRTEAVVPFVIVVVIIWAYFALLFDHHLRKGLEWAATYGNGAEVNIARVHTSFVHASVEMNGIQVTDPTEPAKNRVQVGGTQFKMLWDALLRGKVVIDMASVREIEIGTTREHPGRVLPPPPEKPSYLALAKEKVSRAVLGEAAELMKGFNPTEKLKDLGNLKTEARLKELQAQLSQKEADWKNTLASLPSDKDFSELQHRANSVNVNTSNPAEIPAKVSLVQNILGDAQGRVAAVQAKGDKIVQDVNGFSRDVSGIDEYVKQDRDALEKQLKIPSIDAKSIARQLFGSAALNKVEQAEHYMRLARQYMPAKKKTAADSEIAPKRAKGKTYEFAVTKGYPRFWLKKAEISSHNVEGRLTDVTSNPSLIGRPAVLTLKGDFAKQQIRGIEAKLTLDHTQDEAHESFQAKVDSYPMPEQRVSDSTAFKFGLNPSTAKAGVSADLRGEHLAIMVANSFQNVTYQVAAESKPLEEIVQAVVKGVPTVNVKAVIEGTWSDFDVSVESNLATALQEGLQKQLQAKIAEARKRIESVIQDRVAKQKAELLGRFENTKKQYLSQIEEKKKLAESYQAQATAKLDQAKKQATSGAGGVKDLLKKRLPFGR